MEEAEELADKIIIIEHGTLRHQGTSQMLKKTCNTGYILKLLTNSYFDEETVMKCVKSHIPKATKRVFIFCDLV